MAVMWWQSAEQRRREVEAADAASVARLVRGVCCCRVARNAPSLCLYWSVVCCCGVGVVRRVRVLESCEVPRYVVVVLAFLGLPGFAVMAHLVEWPHL